ncbi:tyrosine-type recombinase/integrase [Sutcliffiella sp. NPDC057660]|uniref:tyrosine-type recombinase/integrase n=1 Tax=Sutcliffiella sp. NPDC057660 TaxID=3346199 RepID=UPI0036803975
MREILLNNVLIVPKPAPRLAPIIPLSVLLVPSIRYSLLQKLFRLFKQANLPKITFHDLRHLHATTLTALDENPKVVADRLGHSRVQVTLDYYSDVSSELQKLTAQKFEEDFFNVNVQFMKFSEQIQPNEACKKSCSPLINKGLQLIR